MRTQNVILCLQLVHRAMSTCYDYIGNTWQGASPCDSSTNRPSICCNKGDYCTSNGLCLNAGLDNSFSQQGCTDSSWSSSCERYCDTSSRREFSPHLVFALARITVSSLQSKNRQAMCIFSIAAPGSVVTTPTVVGSTEVVVTVPMRLSHWRSLRPFFLLRKAPAH